MKAFAASLAGLILLSSNGPNLFATHKYALVVAISEYPGASGYSRINAANDVPLVRGALASQGFATGDITVLRDEGATRQAILRGIASLGDRASPGDALVFHYSGHGHRITDDNGDELDGFDEVLVPYDATLPREHSIPPANHLRDDDLGQALDYLRHKVGSAGSVTVFLDACYSGSATRAAANEPAVRGVAEPIRLRSAAVTLAGVDKAGGVSELGARSGEGVAPLVVISAARHDQVARETYDAERNPVGSLSLAMSIALPRLSRGATYRGLHDRLAAAMAGMNLFDQRPQVEGTIDARVFSGDVVEQKAYHRITTVYGDTALRVGGGRILGLLPGTRLEVHPPGTSDPQQSVAIATGTVTTADQLTAAIRLSKPASVPRDSWAFVTDYSFGELQLNLRFDRGMPASTRASITKDLAGLAVAKVVAEGADVLIRRVPGHTTAIELVDPISGTRIGETIDLAVSRGTGMRDAVSSYARSVMLRKLELRDPRMGARLELIRTAPRIRSVDGEQVCAADPPAPLSDQSRSSEGIELEPGDEYALRIVNDAALPAYVAILDITPDGQVRQLFPLPGHTGSDNLIPPGVAYTIPDICFFAERPSGVEVLKLFATRQRVDFTAILSGSSSRSDDDSPLSRLFSDVFSGTRSAPLAASGSGTTSTLSITIRDPARK